MNRRNELREYLTESLHCEEELVTFAMDLLKIIDSRHSTDILEHLKKEAGES